MIRFILFVCFSVILYGKYYSIQVVSSTKTADVLKVYKNVKNYPFARIERIKTYYTVRVGLANRLEDLKPLLQNVRKKYKDAFLRNVKFLKKRIIICNCKEQKRKYLIFNLIKQKLSFLSSKTKIKKHTQKSTIKFPVYIDFSMALLTNDKEKLKKIVNKNLPYKDKTEALIKLGRINEAFLQINKNLKNDSLDYRVYKQAADFYDVYANRFKFETFLQRSDDIDTLNNEFGLKSFNKSIKFNQSILLKNNNKLYQNLKNLYSLTFSFKYQNSKTEINFNKNYNYFMGIRFDVIYKKLTTQFAINQKSDESIYMLYGGKKHFINIIYNYYLDNRNSISSNLQYNIFYTQNGGYIGQGENFNIRYTNNLRVGYPDFSYYLFLNQGVYKQSNKADILMKKFSSVNNFNVLPDKFYIIGSGFSFGTNRLGGISPEILPFGDISLNYELLNKNLGYNILFGFRKKLFYEDNFMIGINYAKVLNKTNTNPFIKFILRYYYWF